MDLSLKLCLIIVALHASKVSCDHTILLHCSSQEDCLSFTDSDIDARCLGLCSCFFKNNGTETICSPKKLTVFNEIAHCPCRVANTECKNDKCVCRDGFFKSEDKIKCISRIVQLGKSCDVHAQCRHFERNSVCSDGLCQCREGFFQTSNNTCRSLALPKEERAKTCDLSKEACGGAHQECIRNKCVCEKNHIFGLNETECIPYKTYGKTCSDQIQCEMGVGNGTVCEDGICKCDENHTKSLIGDREICQRHIKYMQHCHKDTDCEKYEDDPRMWCINEKCICREGFHLSDGIHFNCVPDEPRSSASKSINVSLLIVIVSLLSVLCCV